MFLKGLNDSYDTVKTQILLIEPLPSVNRIFSLIIHPERQLTGNAMVNSKILLNTSGSEENWKTHHNGGWKSQGRGRNRYQNNGKQCTFCHKLYHTVDECYSKHGFPPWYKRKDERIEKVVNNSVMERGGKIEEVEQPIPVNEGSHFTQEHVHQIMKII